MSQKYWLRELTATKIGVLENCFLFVCLVLFVCLFVFFSLFNLKFSKQKFDQILGL